MIKLLIRGTTKDAPRDKRRATDFQDSRLHVMIGSIQKQEDYFVRHNTPLLENTRLQLRMDSIELFLFSFFLKGISFHRRYASASFVIFASTLRV